MGHMYVAITSKVSAMAPELISRAHLTPGKFIQLQQSKKSLIKTIELVFLNTKNAEMIYL